MKKAEAKKPKATKAPKVEVRIKPSAPILVSSLIPKKADKGPVLPTALFTVGYDGGLTPSALMQIMKDRNLGYVIDTRASTATRVPGWAGPKLKDYFGTRYLSAQTLTDVKATLAGLKCPRAILIRKEEAPGESNFHLEIARMFPVVHLFRDEVIDGHELQRSIDDGDDYECEVPDGPTGSSPDDRISAAG